MLARRTPHRIALIAIAGLVVLSAFWFRALITNSAHPGAYYAYHNHPESFVYPTQEVVGWSTAIVVETAVACACLWRSRSPVATCVAAAATSGVLVFFFLPFVMHAPPYYGCHIAFLVLAALWFVLVAVVAGLARLIARLLGGAASRDNDGSNAAVIDR
jgi:hypothetical protein